MPKLYMPKQFQQHDEAEIHQLISQNSLATLVVNTEQGLEANHIPLFLKEMPSGQYRLQGHIARSNPLHKNCALGEQALAIFQGPDAYISPNYYESKKRDPKVVPTWNYTVVHVRGTINFIEDKDWLLGMLKKLTNQHEVKQKTPWQLADAPESYIDKMIAAVVGVEIDIESIEAKNKASQNQPEENQKSVVKALSASDKDTERLMAETIKQGREHN